MDPSRRAMADREHPLRARRPSCGTPDSARRSGAYASSAMTFTKRAILFLTSIALLAQTPSALDTAREFYTWYVPIALKSDGLAAVLKQRPNALAPALASALK